MSGMLGQGGSVRGVWVVSKRETQVRVNDQIKGYKSQEKEKGGGVVIRRRHKERYMNDRLEERRRF